MRYLPLMIAALAIATAPTGIAMAKKDKDQGNQEKIEWNQDHRQDGSRSSTDRAVDDAATVITEAIFGPREQDMIRQVLGGQSASAYGTRGLPPGIAKKVARGKPVPPGIAKKLSPDVLARLPRRDSRYERQVLGTDVVLIDTATQVVVDILKDVLK